jgi:hypothetical protein
VNRSHDHARLAHLPLLGKSSGEPGVYVIIEPQYLYRVFYVIDGKRCPGHT